MKKTKWFDGSKFIPAHVGVYRAMYESSWGKRIAFKYWDGKFWGAACNYRLAAYEHRRYKSLDQNNDWFGLKEQPK